VGGANSGFRMLVACGGSTACATTQANTCTGTCDED
jgi:hypothetical protein